MHVQLLSADGAGAADPVTGDKNLAEEAARLLSERARRYELFPSELFDEHAWNMLLHLFIALANNQVLSEGRLVDLACAGRSSGQRWIRHLVQDGQLEARDDGGDVVLTREAVERLRAYLRPAVGPSSDAGDA